jgi:hypothetical protein
MYNVQVTQKVPVKDFYGQDVLALPTGEIVRLTAEVPGVGKLQPQLLIRTDCPAHPLVNLMTGKVLTELVPDMKFTLVTDVQTITLIKVEAENEPANDLESLLRNL